MLRKTRLIGLVVVSALFLSIQSCEIIDAVTDIDYDIEVINNTAFTLGIYVDGSLEFSIGGDSSRTIYGVSSGTHTLKATWLGVSMIERSVYMDSDLVWTIDW